MSAETDVVFFKELYQNERKAHSHTLANARAWQRKYEDTVDKQFDLSAEKWEEIFKIQAQLDILSSVNNPLAVPALIKGLKIKLEQLKKEKV